MKSIIFSLISTNRGWIIRQALKYTTVGAAAATTWLVAQGYGAEHAATIVAGVTAGIAGGLELVLSKLASKIAAQ